jgi:hypothetical protein
MNETGGDEEGVGQRSVANSMCALALLLRQDDHAEWKAEYRVTFVAPSNAARPAALTDGIVQQQKAQFEEFYQFTVKYVHDGTIVFLRHFLFSLININF